MNNEPSLLDYLKSLFDPRRPRIQLPDETPPESGTAPWESPAPYALPSSHEFPPVPPPPQGDAEIPIAPPELPPGPFPWRTISMLFLALLAQGALEPPERSLMLGLVLYGLAAIAGVWAYFAREFALPEAADVPYQDDPYTVNRIAILLMLAIAGFAFLIMGGNKFTAFNVFVWAQAIFFGCAAFWLKGEARAPLGPRLQEGVRNLAALFRSRWGVMLLLGFAVAIFFRFYHLDQVPPQMFSDHAEKLQDVQDVLNGETHIFFPRNTGREFVQMYLTAFTAKYLGLGLTFMALKMGVALAGIVTLPFIYLLGKELANRRVGLLALVFAGMSYWLNVITRVALRFSLYPLFVAPVLYHLVRGLRRGERRDFIWAGLWLGLGLHGYSPFRFVPLFVALVVVLFVLHAGTRGKRGQAIWQLGVVIALSFIVFLPLLRYITESEENRALVLYRSMTRIGTVEREYPAVCTPEEKTRCFSLLEFVQRMVGDELTERQRTAIIVVQIFISNLGKAMAMFAWDDGETWVHSVVGRPALDIVSAALFYPAYLLLFLRYLRKRRWEDAFLLVAVPFLMLPSVMSLAFPNENPSLNRTGGAIIPVFIIIALALDGMMRALKGWGGSRWGRAASWGVAGFLLLWSASMNYDIVFHDYYEQFRSASWNTTELGGVIRGFIDSVGTEETAWVIPWPYWVDTRLVGINAGVYIKDYAIPRERLVETTAVPGPKLFLLHPQDVETLAELQRLYPGGTLQTYISEVPDKDFLIYLVLDSSALPPPGAVTPEAYPAPPGVVPPEAYPAP